MREVFLGRVGPKHARLLGLLGSNVDRRSARRESKVVLAGDNPRRARRATRRSLGMAANRFKSVARVNKAMARKGER